MARITDIEKFEWFPLYFRRITGSARYRAMKDYQQGWYLNLLFESAKSEKPGYLKLNGRLWRLANARTEQFFNRENAAVLACFKSREIDGESWISNEKMLEVLNKIFPQLPQEDLKVSSLLSLNLSVVSFEELQKAVQRLFAFYTQSLKKDKRYKLTELREKKAMLRLSECLKESKGDLAAAEMTCREAIENLVNSQWHLDNGHTDWIEQIFKSETEFQKRLVMAKPIIILPKAGECKTHPRSGATALGNCWDCAYPSEAL